MERYTGVLYQELAWATLPAGRPAARRPAGAHRCRGCGGSVAPTDPHPAVPAQDVGVARRAWAACRRGGGRGSAPVLAELTRGARGVGPAPATSTRRRWTGAPRRPARRVTVRFLDAQGRTVSHWNKLLKGSLVRWLLTEQPLGPEALGSFRHPLGYRFDRAGIRRSTVTSPPSSCAPPRRLTADVGPPPLLDRAHPRAGRAGLPPGRRRCSGCATSSSASTSCSSGWRAASCRSSCTSSGTASP